MSNENPFIEKPKTAFDSICFTKIKPEHFVPAIEFYIEAAKKNLDALKQNPEKANFENTIQAIDHLSNELDTVNLVYNNLYGANSDEELRSLAEKIAPMISSFSTEVTTDPELFERIRSVYEKRKNLGLSEEDIRLTELTYKNFLRGGADLDETDKENFKEITKKLSVIPSSFSKNVLATTNSYELYFADASRLESLPESCLQMAKAEAKKRGHKDGYSLTLQIPSYLPVMTKCEDREIRKEIYLAYSSRATGGENDNSENIKNLVKLRLEKARLLGFENHAAFTLDSRMAKKPETVWDFLGQLVHYSAPKAEEELKEIKDFANQSDGIEELMAWDVNFYAEKLKQKKFDFDSESLRPYFSAENVINGVFEIARRLYGISFEETSDVELYHPEVRCFCVKDENNELIGLFYIDLFPRASKMAGAWMTEYKEQYDIGSESSLPHVSIVCNMTPPGEDRPSLLLLNEVRTIFHEFGHALHGLLSKVKHKALSGPKVFWDFVELPSQIMENWILEPEVLDLIGKHYESGESIPSELVEKIKASSKFFRGYQSLRQLNLGILDFAWHTIEETNGLSDIIDFEHSVTSVTSLIPPANQECNISNSFGHIFAGGYSAGYYSYKWAEVLDADAFSKFKEDGIFNKSTASAFRENILSKGNSEDPNTLYKKFRGRDAKINALLERDGILE